MLKKSLFHILPDVLSYLISGARLDTVPVPNIKKPETCDPKSGSCSLFFFFSWQFYKKYIDKIKKGIWIRNILFLAHYSVPVPTLFA